MVCTVNATSQVFLAVTWINFVLLGLCRRIRKSVDNIYSGDESEFSCAGERNAGNGEATATANDGEF